MKTYILIMLIIGLNSVGVYAKKWEQTDKTSSEKLASTLSCLLLIIAYIIAIVFSVKLM